MPVAAVVALVAVVVGFTVWAGATHSEQVLPRRDAASNLQAAVSLATTHTRVVPVDAESVGGAGVLDLDGVTLASPAFFEVGSSADPAVEPQFVVGPAVVYAFGWWAGGAGVALVLPAVAMGLALLALGLLVARVAGPWAGVATAALTGILFPVLHTARATYSEPLAMLTLTAGLLAATLAVAAGREAAATPAGFVGDASSQGQVVTRAPLRSLVLRDASARAGLLAGLLVGGTGLVRVDALREVVLLLPVVALGAAFGGRWARPLLVGLGLSLGVSAVAAAGLSWQYLASIAASLVPLLALGVLVGGASWVALVLWRRGWRLPSSVVRWVPDVAAGLVVLAGIYLASRPLWQLVRQDPTDPGARYVAGMQARQGLPVDGGRTYAEQTVVWLSWYVGPVALVAALVVLAGARAAGRGVGGGAARRGLGAGARRRGRVDPVDAPASGHHARPPVGRPAPPRRAAPRRRAPRRGGRLARASISGVGPDVARGHGRGRGGRARRRAGARRDVAASWRRGGARVAGRGGVGVRRAGPG